MEGGGGGGGRGDIRAFGFRVKALYLQNLLQGSLCLTSGVRVFGA